MKATTTSVLLVLTLVQCVFSASVTLVQPKEDRFGTGTCFKMWWNRQGLPDGHYFNVTFKREDGTVALEENVGEYKYLDVKLPSELATYTLYVEAFNADGSVLATSTTKTAIVTDLACYPEKSK